MNQILETDADQRVDGEQLATPDNSAVGAGECARYEAVSPIAAVVRIEDRNRTATKVVFASEAAEE